jgi:hypothetical protein
LHNRWGANLLYKIISEVSKGADLKTEEETIKCSVQFSLDSGCFKELPAHLYSYAFLGRCPTKIYWNRTEIQYGAIRK